MNIIEALTLAKDHGRKVRPRSWRFLGPGLWVELRRHVFVEMGAAEEMPHALRLQHPDEFLGEWEELP